MFLGYSSYEKGTYLDVDTSLCLDYRFGKEIKVSKRSKRDIANYLVKPYR